MAKRRKVSPLRPLFITPGPWCIAQPALPVGEWMKTGATAGGISSTVVSLSYDLKTRTLYVTFRGYKTKPNVTYFYYGVPPIEARNFYHASSLGIFVARRLEPFYYYQKL
jgi:hypothetical protein